MYIGVNTLFMIPGEVGGAETYLRESLKALVRRPGVSLVLFTNRENDAVLRDDLAGSGNAEFRKLSVTASRRPERIIREQVELPVRVRRANIDLLWSPGYTAPLLCRVPQVVSVLDMQYKRHPEDLSTVARLTTDFLVKSACRVCAGVVAISEFSKQEVIRYTSADAGKVFVVHAGVSSAFGDNGGQAPIVDGVALEEPYLLCVANSYPHKNLPTLVDAFSQVADSIPHRLVLVGKPRLGEAELQRRLDQAPRGRVMRLQGVSPGELKWLYQHAGLFVLPSVYEGFGLPVVEAMVAGVPVITSRRASLPEVGGDHACYADPPQADEFASRIREVAAWTQAARSEWTEAARAWALTFSWDASAEALHLCFERVLALRAQR